MNKLLLSLTATLMVSAGAFAAAPKPRPTCSGSLGAVYGIYLVSTSTTASDTNGMTSPAEHVVGKPASPPTLDAGTGTGTCFGGNWPYNPTGGWQGQTVHFADTANTPKDTVQETFYFKGQEYNNGTKWATVEVQETSGSPCTVVSTGGTTSYGYEVALCGQN